jgi:hypothetical protein
VFSSHTARKIEPALFCGEIGDISNKLIGGVRAREVTMYKIRLWFGISVRDSGSLLICKGGEPSIFKFAHAFSYPVEGSVGKTHQLDSSGVNLAPKPLSESTHKCQIASVSSLHPFSGAPLEHP